MKNNAQSNSGGKNSDNLKIISQEMESVALKALEIAKKLGADDAKISASCSFQKRLVVENKVFTLANSLDTQKFGILVQKDNKKGSASINSRNPDAIAQAIKDALSLASFSVPDEHMTMSTPDIAPPTKAHAFQYDAATADIELGELQELMQAGLIHATKDPRVSIDKYEMSADTSFHGIYNTRGVKQSETQTMLNWFLFGMAVDGEEVSGFDYDGNFAFNKANVGAKIIDSSNEFARRVLLNLRPRKSPSYKGLVLLSPRAIDDFITGFILYHASGSSVMDGKSSWTNSIGTKVLSDKFSLQDSPHDPRFSGATSFDGDGLPTRDQFIVENGILKTHLHDCYSAKRCKTKSNALSGGPFAMRVAKGSDDLAKLQSSRDELLVIDRFAGNSDPIKGDFSGVAKSSRLFVKGKDAGCVTETMVAGNFFEIAHAIAGVSNITEIISGSGENPWILLDGVSVTGN